MRGPVGVLVGLLLVMGTPACRDGGDDASTPDPGSRVEGRAPGTGEGRAGTEPASTADPGTPLSGVEVALVEVATAESPVKLVSRPGHDLVYVAEQGGRVVTFSPGQDWEAGDVALDLDDLVRAGGEQGLLGLAFAPDGETMYVHHSGPDGETRLAAYAMDGDVVDEDSRVELLRVDQPFPNHNGGEIVVDGDGLLWIGLGDGGAADDPDDRAQDPDDLLGKILRIDPAHPTDGRPYGIPADNPFGGGGRPEIAVTGVRNPWRFRFDAATGDLWVADVGQDRWEEINRLPADAVLGSNLGWSRYEGSHDFDADHGIQGDAEPTVPVFEMSHDDGWCSVTGGPVYRGDVIAGLDGAYLFGDFCKPGLFAVRVGTGGAVDDTVLDDDVGRVVSIDTTSDGNVYVLSLDGTISRVDAG